MGPHRAKMMLNEEYEGSIGAVDCLRHAVVVSGGAVMESFAGLLAFLMILCLHDCFVEVGGANFYGRHQDHYSPYCMTRNDKNCIGSILEGTL